jgi:predicted Ser/Thr protein kinase
VGKIDIRKLELFARMTRRSTVIRGGLCLANQGPLSLSRCSRRLLFSISLLTVSQEANFKGTRFWAIPFDGIVMAHLNERKPSGTTRTTKFSWIVLAIVKVPYCLRARRKSAFMKS